MYNKIEASFLRLMDRRSEFYQWLLHNIIFGLAGVWMPFVVLACFGRWRVREVLTDGSLLMFVVTLSAVSLGFFFKETRISLRRAHTLTYAALMLTMIFGVLVLTALFLAPVIASSNTSTITSSRVPIQLNLPFIYWSTGILTLLAIISNFRLFLTELSGIETVNRRLNSVADSLTQAAGTAQEVDGVSL